MRGLLLSSGLAVASLFHLEVSWSRDGIALSDPLSSSRLSPPGNSGSRVRPVGFIRQALQSRAPALQLNAVVGKLVDGCLLVPAAVLCGLLATLGIIESPLGGTCGFIAPGFVIISQCLGPGPRTFSNFERQRTTCPSATEEDCLNIRPASDNMLCACCQLRTNNPGVKGRVLLLLHETY
jgi:hypothetical protein